MEADSTGYASLLAQNTLELTSRGSCPRSAVSLARSAQVPRDPCGRRRGVEPHNWILGEGMSAKSLTADLCRAARRARGKQSRDTHTSREQTLANFARFLWESGFQIHITRQLKEKHLVAWVASMKTRHLADRTIANYLGHVRTALCGIKREAFAARLSNAVLGIGGTSRKGTKAPLPNEAFTAYLAKAEMVDLGVAMALELQREFGLRAAEAVRSTRSLPDWLLALSNPFGDGFITVIHGTKGGKTRRCPALNRDQAITLVERAIALSNRYKGKLIPKSELRHAMDRYHYVVRTIGMIGEQAPHSLRYSYATEHLQRLKAAGVSRQQAAAGVSTWLGHGDGRGTWVMSVYGRAALESGEDQNA